VRAHGACSPASIPRGLQRGRCIALGPRPGPRPGQRGCWPRREATYYSGDASTERVRPSTCGPAPPTTGFCRCCATRGRCSACLAAATSLMARRRNGLRILAIVTKRYDISFDGSRLCLAEPQSRRAGKVGPGNTGIYPVDAGGQKQNILGYRWPFWARFLRATVGEEAASRYSAVLWRSGAFGRLRWPVEVPRHAAYGKPADVPSPDTACLVVTPFSGQVAAVKTISRQSTR